MKIFKEDGIEVEIRHIASIPETKKYDKKYLEESDYGLTSIVEVSILKNGANWKTAIIGAAMGATGVDHTSFVSEDDRLVICCSNYILCLSIPDLDLLWRTIADDITCFEVFKFKDRYIVHGELLISALDIDGNILWQQGGADIFTTPEGVETFQLNDQYILAKDWDYKIYKFDYDGNVL
jgi:hypothetical protein